jgi:hypothetical protein
VLIHDLLATLGTAEVLHHLRIGEESTDGPKIIVGPRQQLDHVSQASYPYSATISSICQT